MSVIKLSDMTGYHTLIDWCNALDSNKLHLCKTVNELDENKRSSLIYFLSNGIAPFSIFCIVYEGCFYISTGADELYSMVRFIKGEYGISKVCWEFDSPFPANIETGNLGYWNDINKKQTILLTKMAVQYVSLDNEKDFKAVINYYSK